MINHLPDGTRVLSVQDSKHGTVQKTLAHDKAGVAFVWVVKDDDGFDWVAFEGDLHILEDEDGASAERGQHQGRS